MGNIGSLGGGGIVGRVGGNGIEEVDALSPVSLSFSGCSSPSSDCFDISTGGCGNAIKRIEIH